MNLHRLFKECINIPYEGIDGSANFALRKEWQTLYIFFEWSRGATDWRSNLDFPAVAYKRMGKTVWFAHRGFVDAWKLTEPHLESAIADTSLKNIVITGYSHGAAIAVLCHEYVWYHRPDLRDKTRGYGFGCPRVLWGALSDEVRKRWERFTVIRNIDDVVTHLPPALLGYTHVGSLLKIGEQNKYSPTDAHRPENYLYELENYETKIGVIN